MKRTEYKNQFNKEHYERINLSIPKGMKEIIKSLAADKGMSMNKYFLFLVNQDQEGLFDNMQLSEKSRDKILTIKGNTHDGYDLYLKDGRAVHFRTKFEIRRYLAQDSKSLTQDS